MHLSRFVRKVACYLRKYAGVLEYLGTSPDHFASIWAELCGESAYFSRLLLVTAKKGTLYFPAQ